MADIQLHTHTRDIEISAPQTKDVIIGSPMDKGGVLSITKNGKHVVSGYDIAEVDIDDTRRVMTEFINSGGSLAYYTGTEMPNIDWDKVTRTNWDGFFAYSKNISIVNVNLNNVINAYNIFKGTSFVEDNIVIDLPNATQFSLSTPNIKNSVSVHIPKVKSLMNFIYTCNVKEVTLDAENLESMTYSFYACGSLKSIHSIKCGKISSFIRMFNDGLSTLTDLGELIDFGRAVNRPTTTPLYLAGAPNLTHQSLLNVINSVYDLTEKGFSLIIQLGKTNYNKLTEADIKIATDKGWTVTQ